MDSSSRGPGRGPAARRCLHEMPDDAPEFDPSGAGFCAAAAARAAQAAELLFHEDELAEVAVAEAFVHARPRRRAAGDTGGAVQLAGVVAADLDEVPPLAFVVQNETVTRRADMGAGPAAHALPGLLFPHLGRG